MFYSPIKYYPKVIIIMFQKPFIDHLFMTKICIKGILKKFPIIV